MGGGTSQMLSSVQRTKNNILQSSYAECSNNFSQNTSGISITIRGSVVSGDVTIGNENISYNTSCIIKNALENLVDNKQDSTQRGIIRESFLGALTEALFGRKNNSEAKSTQDIVNDVTQILSSYCQNKNIQNNINNEIVIENTIVRGGVSIGNKMENNNVQCNIDNIARSVLQNDQSSDQVLENQTWISMIINAIILCAIIGLIFIVVKTIGSIAAKKSDTSEQQPAPPPLTAVPVTAPPPVQAVPVTAVPEGQAVPIASKTGQSPLKINKVTKPKQSYKSNMSPLSLGLRYLSKRGMLQKIFNSNIR